MYLSKVLIFTISAAFCIAVCESNGDVHNNQNNVGPSTSSGNFKLLHSVKAFNEIPVYKYESQKTHIKVVVAEVESPEVAGYFALATEAHDDDGLPHTLEHLIFLGSEDYPYKGVLDLLANRCMASGTNAWTATDHTAYTIKTAGSEGFLSMLPIYLDHVLYPTLTDAGFKTEVYHVTGEGTDGGVVYSEMEGRETSSDSVTERAFLRAVYPGKCGYKSETGGILKNLRESTTNQKVKDYHKAFYRPENLTLIVAGIIKPEEIFKALEKFENKVQEKEKNLGRGAYQRPWTTHCDPLTTSVDTEVRYPSDVEDSGMIYVGWRGPPVKEYETFSALQILLDYLSSSDSSILMKKFVDIADPLASGVNYFTYEYLDTVVALQFSDVPVPKMKEIKPKLHTILSDIVSGKEKIDVKRMSTVIHKRKLDALSSIDSDPHGTIASSVISDMLYGNNQEDFQVRLNELSLLEKLEKNNASFWTELVKKYLVEGKSVTVRGVPSIKEQEALDKANTDRVQKRKDSLKKEGLAQKKRELEEAEATNDRPVPDNVLTSVPLPKSDKFHYLPIEQYTTDSPNQHAHFDASKAPVYMLVDHINSKLVYMTAALDASKLTKQERLYLPLICELLLETPIKRGDKEIPYEQIALELEQDTYQSTANLGFRSNRFDCGPYCQTPFLSITVEPEKYEKGITWIREGLYQTVITEERVRSISSRLLNQIPSVQSDSNTIVNELMNGILYNDESNAYVVSTVRQKKFLGSIQKSMDKPEEVKRIVGEIEKVLKSIANPDNLVIYLACDLNKVSAIVKKDLAAAWNQVLPPGVNSAKNKLKPIPDHTVMKPEAEIKRQDLSCITGIGSISSAYLLQGTPAIKDFKSNELVPLRVFAQYLTQMEGAMWKRIRGGGFAYGYEMYSTPNDGLLYFSLYRATDLIGGFNEAIKILKENTDEKTQWNPVYFDSAKNSYLYQIVSGENTITSLSFRSLISYFKEIPFNYNREMVQKTLNVPLNEVRAAGQKYVSHLVTVKDTEVAIVSDPGRTKPIATAFEGLGKKLKVYANLEASHLNK